VAIPADVEAKVTYDLLEVPFAQGQEPDGEGTYNFYFNVGEFLVYTTKEGGGEQPHDPEEHIYLVIVGEDQYELTLDEGAEKEQYKKMDVAVGPQDAVSVTADGEVVPFAQGHEPDGEGIYDFYYVPADECVYITKHAQEPEQPKISLFVGAVEHEMLLDEGAEKLQYKVLDVVLGEGDLAVVKVDDDPVDFAVGHEPDGAGTYDFYYVPDDGLVYITKHPQDPQPEENVILDVHNDDEWEAVYAYAWNGDPSDGTLEEFLGKWCGTEMEPVQDHDGWFSIEVSVNAQNVLFCNGIDGEGSAQTDDLAISARTPYYDWKNKAWSATFVEHEPEQPQDPEATLTLYFHNEAGWASVNAYAWTDGQDGEPATLYLGEWGGKAMDAVQDHEG
ncbi:MAG: starch-binding protein, partial [Clostridia bacterium]|nr:starch-binding protein [Clostridia bacterium]